MTAGDIKLGGTLTGSSKRVGGMVDEKTATGGFRLGESVVESDLKLDEFIMNNLLDEIMTDERLNLLGEAFMDESGEMMN